MMALLASVEGSAFFIWLRESDSIWAFPAVLTMHTLGTMLLGGASTALNLRLLGAGRQIPVDSLRRLVPLMWLGLMVNIVSGTLLFCADATAKATMPMFLAKLAFVAAGGLTVVLIQRAVFGAMSKPEDARQPGRGLATASLLAWFATIVAGRLLAYVAT